LQTVVAMLPVYRGSGAGLEADTRITVPPGKVFLISGSLDVCMGFPVMWVGVYKSLTKVF